MGLTAAKEIPSRSVTAAHNQPSKVTRRVRWIVLLNVVVLLGLIHLLYRPTIPSLLSNQVPGHQSLSHQCHAPLPSFLATEPPSGTEDLLQKAFEQVDAALQRRFDEGGIDSISVGIVSSGGALYEGFWGKRRANESDSPTVDRHSIYRIASISKLFTAAETYILRDRGVLCLDDPISSVCPEFRYHTYYSPITFRALMTHMSGIGRDLPPGDARGHWPKSIFGGGPAEYNGREFPTNQDIFDGIAQNRPIFPPYTHPVYSNTGYGILGIANVAANRAVNGPSEPSSHAELLKRDIFEPLRLNGSSFLTTEENIHKVVVGSVASYEIVGNFCCLICNFEPIFAQDQDMLDGSNPTGGQMSSLADLASFMQVIINPRRQESVLSTYTVREWMRPQHVWFDDFSEVGALWEIYSSTDSYGRKQKFYQKLGELEGYHSGFTVNPVNSYGIIVLQTGPTSETIQLTKLITSYVQEAFDRVLEETTRRRLVGTWRSSDSLASLTLEIHHGSLYVSEYVINGTNVLEVMQGGKASHSLPLWSTTESEYRIAVPSSFEGCFFSWTDFDGYGYIDGVSVNVIEVAGDENDPAFFLPAVNQTLLRQ